MSWCGECLEEGGRSVRKDVTTDLRSLFRVLRGRNFIGASNFDITDARLNPNDSRNLRQNVPWISRALYQRLAEGEISFDAIAGVPSGGEPYARHLVEMLLLLDEKSIPQVWLEKADWHMRVEDRGGLARGARVILIEDCVYTGNAIRKATEALGRAGIQVAAYLTIADLNYDGSRQLSAPLLSVFSREFLRQEKIYA